ncbi:MAG: hypothetical protein K9L68_13040 [Spirochaetales bacterium]|nr:hypothetical protein [Spirochaetales bacterium]
MKDQRTKERFWAAQQRPEELAQQQAADEKRREDLLAVMEEVSQGNAGAQRKLKEIRQIIKGEK